MKGYLQPGHMVIAIKGRAPYNEYKVSKYYEGYRRQYIIRFAKSYDFFKWENNVTKPLLGNRYLIEITETEWVRDLNGLIEKLESYIDHDYIDIIWYPEDLKIDNHVMEIETLNLRESYREDFLHTVREDFKTTPTDVIETLIKKVNYRWATYSIYRDILLEKYGETLTSAHINKTIETEYSKSATEVLKAIILKERFALNNYYKLQEKYSKRWVKSYLPTEIDKILKCKIELANRDKTLTDIRRDRKLSKYYYIIINISIPHLQILRLLCNEPLGIEVWVKNSPNDIFNNYLLKKENQHE